MILKGASPGCQRSASMRRASCGAWLISGWLMCVAVLSTLAFIVDMTPAHALAAARTACGGSSSASGTSTQATKGAARISLNTAQGVAGTQVIVSGTGWPVGEHVLI